VRIINVDRMKRTLAVLMMIVAALGGPGAIAQQQEVLDRIVAVIGNEIITQSELDTACPHGKAQPRGHERRSCQKAST
jgi:hypothetical protein